MAYLHMETLLHELRHHIKSALSEAVREHVEENVDSEALYSTFVAATVRRCAKPQYISEKAVAP